MIFLRRVRPSLLESFQRLLFGREVLVPRGDSAPGGRSIGSTWENAMKKWKTPRIRLISVGCEINAYACADI
jgi:coenzyme PQQ precursor peptide PqqA